MSPGAGLRGVRAGTALAAILIGATVVSACATSVEVDLGEQADVSRAGGDDGGPEPPPTPVAPASTPTPAATPTAAPSVTPTPTVRPQLPYEEAVSAFFDDIERFWGGPAGAELGIEFTPVREQIRYDPADLESIPTCDGQIGPAEIYDSNAFYCEPDDYIAWDDVTLFPELYRVYGDVSVGLVIAHEYGHAVQTQAGFSGPTIFLELQADCLAGAWAGSVAARGAGSVSFGRADLDDAIGGFLTFADPLGTSAGDPGAHGTAFDRLNAFAEGFEGGVGTCPRFVTDPPTTASLVVDRFDENAGNLPLDQLLPLLVEDLSTFLDGLGEELLGPAFDAPGQVIELPRVAGDRLACDVVAAAPDVAGSAFYCELDGEVYADRAELEEVWSEVGDFAPAYAVAHAFAMAVAVELVDGPDRAVLAADCLVGVWSRDVFEEASADPDDTTHVIFLSAGDLDEGIVGLLLVEPTGPSLAELSTIRTFDRVAAFGRGFFRGSTDCDIT